MLVIRLSLHKLTLSQKSAFWVTYLLTNEYEDPSRDGRGYVHAILLLKQASNLEERQKTSERQAQNTWEERFRLRGRFVRSTIQHHHRSGERLVRRRRGEVQGHITQPDVEFHNPSTRGSLYWRSLDPFAGAQRDAIQLREVLKLLVLRCNPI